MLNRQFKGDWELTLAAIMEALETSENQSGGEETMATRPTLDARFSKRDGGLCP